MEKSTFIGLALGFIAIIVGMLFKGASLSSLVNPAAYLIIFVGTAASLFIAFPMNEISKFPKLMKIALFGQQRIAKIEVMRLFVEWAAITRREGLLALEGKIDEVTEPFLKNGLRLIIDGNDHDFVSDVLSEEIHLTEERHKMGALVFAQAGTYAPTLGVLGAVIGLVAALGNLSDIEKLGHSIAAAFIATLLGIFSGYVLWHPIANKLKRISKQEMETKTMMTEGILGIQAGLSAIALGQKLAVFLTPQERTLFEQEGGGAG
ncbi:MAG: flagellar motor stator protein MotA [Paenibacillaceae bacterium]|jgi:chemotaxis protein MotA|nr:flagellar motor stator protein MotA [Paenibacillaceae bacterium]